MDCPRSTTLADCSLVLLKSRFQIIGVHPVHVCRRAALHQLAQNCDILYFPLTVHEIRPLFLSCGHGF